MKNSFVIKNSIIYFFAYFLYCGFFSLLVPYLTHIGFTPSQRGLMQALIAITSILFQFFYGYLCDKYKKEKKFIIILLVITSLVCSAFYMYPMSLFIIQLIFVGLSGGLVYTNYSGLDNWVFTYGEDARNKFSLIRTFGSVGWAFASVIFAMIVSKFSYPGVSIAMLVCMIITISFILLVNEPVEVIVIEKNKITMKEFNEMLSNKKYLLLILILFLLFCAYACSGTAVIEKMLILNASSSAIGLKWAVCAGAEIPFYFFGYQIVKRVGSYRLLTIASFATFVQYVLFGFTTNVFGMIILNVFQMMTLPVINLVSRYLFFEYAPEKLINTSMMFAICIFQGISMLIMPIIIGYIIENFHVNFVLFGVSILCLIACFLTFSLNKLAHPKIA